MHQELQQLVLTSLHKKQALLAVRVVCDKPRLLVQGMDTKQWKSQIATGFEQKEEQWQI